jgi:hypothetical protein
MPIVRRIYGVINFENQTIISRDDKNIHIREYPRIKSVMNMEWII